MAVSRRDFSPARLAAPSLAADTTASASAWQAASGKRHATSGPKVSQDKAGAREGGRKGARGKTPGACSPICASHLVRAGNGGVTGPLQHCDFLERIAESLTHSDSVRPSLDDGNTVLFTAGYTHIGWLHFTTE